MIKRLVIQSCLSLLNLYNKVGQDHALLVKVPSIAVVFRLLGFSEKRVRENFP